MRRATVLSLAPMIVDWFLGDDDEDRAFGRSYRDIVRVFKDSPKSYQLDLSPQYLALLRYRDGILNSDFAIANEHDVANLHRAVWLLMLHALARLLNYNLHGDWGDPPGGATSQGRYDDPPPKHDLTEGFHTTPNAYGSYAISTQDIPAPDLGIGEAPYPPTMQPVSAVVGNPLSPAEIKNCAVTLARNLAYRRNLDDYGQHPYHRIVKRFYLDRGDHTTEYAVVIGDAVYPQNPDNPKDPQNLINAQAAANLAGRITAQDVANIHRGAWLFLAHRFSFVVGKNPFGGYGPVDPHVGADHVDLPNAEAADRVFEVPNGVMKAYFTLNLDDIDPDDDP